MEKRSTYLKEEDFIKAKTEQEYLDKVYEVNQNIIQYILNLVNIPQNVDINRCEEVLSDALIKAIDTYNPSQNSFRRYAFRCMYNSLLSHLKNITYPNKKYIDVLDVDSTISLESLVIKKGKNFYPYKDIASDKSYESEIYQQTHPSPIIENLLNLLTEKERKYIEIFASDKRIEEFALEQGVTRSAIYQYKAQLSNKIAKNLKTSTLIGGLRERGFTSEQISTKLNIPPRKVKRYYQIYQYIYLDKQISSSILLV